MKMAPDNKIERLRAERDDLLKANALLHALIGNREAEIERLRAVLQCGMSWGDGFNISGDRKSIDEAGRLLHEAGKVGDLTNLLIEARAENERLRSVLKQITSGGLGLFGSKEVARAALEQKSP
jgi:hypothetical protein